VRLLRLNRLGKKQQGARESGKKKRTDESNVPASAGAIKSFYALNEGGDQLLVLVGNSIFVKEDAKRGQTSLFALQAVSKD